MKKIIAMLICISSFNCEELIEVEDISNELIVILAPVNDTTLNTATVNFSWQPIEYAEAYHLQIATPSFEAAQQIIEDTTIVSTSFLKNLSANQYQWRIKASNSAYQTDYTTQTLTIED